MTEPGPVGCLFFFNHSFFTHNGVTEAQASTGHQLEWESARKITAAEDTVQGAQGRLSDTLVSSCRSPLFGVRRVKLFILGAESFSFSPCPSFDLFWCRVAVSRKYSMFETKCAQFLLQAFEAKPSDQNKERQWEGGAAETQPEGGIQATRADFDIPTQHNSEASLLHSWGWGESSCQEVKWLKRKARHIHFWNNSEASDLSSSPRRCYQEQVGER